MNRYNTRIEMNPNPRDVNYQRIEELSNLVQTASKANKKTLSPRQTRSLLINNGLLEN
jgi:hypothetical protein